MSKIERQVADLLAVELAKLTRQQDREPTRWEYAHSFGAACEKFGFCPDDQSALRIFTIASKEIRKARRIADVIAAMAR
ncbi:hypothetical protein NLM33_35780 [Bradyrhizobium sp. CCGUVB1N3]|uniref:hypothetical protein n=1 Tax=Bradyrhizobium sp. CCGUVB1N3 TaxID=2949629 RepID=UPI0020B291B7|nr:hypothetical protein [Bradyrhizobium sp. CCGUVB1N3]MCP3475636.1 hypothetical protein [Bradyrhizobium sp. CCGUVB1N3]